MPVACSRSPLLGGAFHGQDLTGGDIHQLLLRPSGPVDEEPIDDRTIAESEVEAHAVLSKVGPATRHLPYLLLFAGDDHDAGADGGGSDRIAPTAGHAARDSSQIRQARSRRP